jgi:hypothetical protein
MTTTLTIDPKLQKSPEPITMQSNKATPKNLISAYGFMLVASYFKLPSIPRTPSVNTSSTPGPHQATLTS